MQSFNKIFLLGYLGQNPQMYTTSTGKPYAGLSLATHRSTQQRSENGETKKATDWHFIHVWGKQAEHCTKYLTKGSAVMVEGYLTQYQKANEAGELQNRTGITAVTVSFLPCAIPQKDATAEG